MSDRLHRRQTVEGDRLARFVLARSAIASYTPPTPIQFPIRWDDKFRLDVWCVDHWSLRFDAQILAQILALPVLRVAKASGISNEASAIMPEFMGGEAP